MDKKPFNSTEQIIWQGRPALSIKLPKYGIIVTLWLTTIILSLIFNLPWGFNIVTAIFLLLSIIDYLQINSTDFQLTNQRLCFAKGILSRREEEVELYRIQDTYQTSSFLQRIYGLETITIHSSDLETPIVTLQNIKDASTLRGTLRIAVEEARNLKHVANIDIAGHDTANFNMETIDQIFGDKWKNTYTVSWCDLCDNAIISCPICKNSSCNGSSCDKCHKDFIEFENSKTCPTQYLNKQESEIYKKGVRLQNLILKSLRRNETEIDWEKTAREGNLSEHDMKHICGWSDTKIKQINEEFEQFHNKISK